MQMNKRKALSLVKDYFKKANIGYRPLNEDGCLKDMEDIDTLYFATEDDNVISKIVETSIRFKDEHMYCQTYYCQPIEAEDGHGDERAARIVNYINGNVSYQMDNLYDRTIVYDEDYKDVYSGSLIRYEMLEKYFTDTMWYILNFCPHMMGDLCYSIVGYICGTLDFDKAKESIGVMQEIRGSR